ncbi:hypothetical protein C7446_1468 [Kushneria sinocarnis]|uniref:Uncharacterized protein n=1 Tax=Kushneria sinocarnis TaxID=595502 RepID=A0A420WX17_9GAMM|nr:hypothetical protein [Kushneria sinocarnis]RKR04264.1 hypothetical protein C7446_1468 [Kushneria sinocarnis]
MSGELNTGDDFEAINDEQYSPPRPRKGELCARRRIEALLEERQLRQALADSWGSDEEE